MTVPGGEVSTPDEISRQLEAVRSTLEQVLRQTTATNGRVGRLEDAQSQLVTGVSQLETAVFGDERRHIVGLMDQVHELRAFVLDGRAVLRTVKFGIPFLVPSCVAIAIAAIW